MDVGSMKFGTPQAVNRASQILSTPVNTLGTLPLPEGHSRCISTHTRTIGGSLHPVYQPVLRRAQDSLNDCTQRTGQKPNPKHLVNHIEYSVTSLIATLSLKRHLNNNGLLTHHRILRVLILDMWQPGRPNTF
jgi:hypothetical protein